VPSTAICSVSTIGATVRGKNDQSGVSSSTIFVAPFRQFATIGATSSPRRCPEGT
jgi:hypothetical protein